MGAAIFFDRWYIAVGSYAWGSVFRGVASALAIRNSIRAVCSGGASLSGGMRHSLLSGVVAQLVGIANPARVLCDFGRIALQTGLAIPTSCATFPE